MTLIYFLIGYSYVGACTYVAVLLCLPESASYGQRRTALLVSTLAGIFWPLFVGPRLIYKAIKD